MGARLFVIPGSHPSMAARLMLERKGVSYRRVDLMPVLAKGVVRVLGFHGGTVPALMLDGGRVQGSRQIARALEAARPRPALFPAGPAARSDVEEAERFGDEVVQPLARRLAWWALRRNTAPLASFAQGARLGVPIGLAVRTAPPIVWAAARLNSASDAFVRADLTALPALLDHVDAWIARGVIGGGEPNAADYQLATSVRLMLCLDDLRAAVERRPSGHLARRLVPDFPGRVGPVFPQEWLASMEREKMVGS